MRVGDLDPCDQEPEVVLRQRVVARHEDAADVLLEPLHGRLREQVRWWWHDGHHLRERLAKVITLCAKLDQALDAEIGRKGAGLERILPPPELLLDALQLDLHLAKSLVRLVPEQAGLFEDVLKDDLAALIGEELVSEVLDDRLVQLVGRDAEAAALV